MAGREAKRTRGEEETLFLFENSRMFLDLKGVEVFTLLLNSYLPSC